MNQPIFDTQTLQLKQKEGTEEIGLKREDCRIDPKLPVTTETLPAVIPDKALIVQEDIMKQELTTQRLRKENLAFMGTGGISQNNRSSGFLPAFYDTESDTVQLARFSDGSPAPMHLLDGLPDEWVQQRYPSGRVAAIKNSVVSGFLRQGRFYTREQAALAC